ncbi:MAG TPA: Hsp20/alpha crystallin family protein [bacterium]|nr:Hsp20/alpha crystallin family protein [bacterium]
MTYLSLIPRPRRGQTPALWGFDRLFEDFFNDLGVLPAGVPDFNARLDVAETDKAVTVTADLPGLDEKDIELSLNDNVLSLKGEKKAEEEGKNYFRKERTYGAFYREIEIPAEVDAAKVEAAFKNGVLTVTLPKSEKSKETSRKIPIKAA